MNPRMTEAQDVIDSGAHFDMMTKAHGETPLTGLGFVTEIGTSGGEAEVGLAAPHTAGARVGVEPPGAPGASVSVRQSSVSREDSRGEGSRLMQSFLSGSTSLFNDKLSERPRRA